MLCNSHTAHVDLRFAAANVFYTRLTPRLFEVPSVEQAAPIWALQEALAAESEAAVVCPRLTCR